jgi:DNA-binding beta-propeller fold protein YncE
VRSKYNYPTGLASDDDGNPYVSNTHSDEIKVISSEGKEKLFAKGLNIFK